MEKFVPRFEAPTKDNKYYNSKEYSDFVGTEYDMFKKGGNCTSYAFSRFAEIIGRKPVGIMTSNAENWYQESYNFKKGKTPKLGAIACWKCGELHKPSDGAGHVAIVEKIEGNTITISESGTNMLFRVKELPYPYVYGSKYQFEGFIYPGIEFEQDDTFETFKSDLKEVLGVANDADLLSKTPTISTSTGWNHKAVRPLQVYLQSLGYDLGSKGVDGQFGKDMKACIKKYQKDVGLASKYQDGIVTAKMYTWKKLLKLS